MTNQTNDQMLRIQCLQICNGSVAEAKNAYYWVTGEGAKSVGAQIGQQALQGSDRLQQQRAVIAGGPIRDTFPINNRIGGGIGGGSPD